jgi:hypothetical protein
MGAGMLRGWVNIWSLDLVALSAAVVLLLFVVAVVDVVATIRGNGR